MPERPTQWVWWALVPVLLYVGCADRSGRSKAPKQPAADAVVAGDGALVRVEDLYGKYSVCDYASCSGEPGDWAGMYIGSEGVVLPEVFAMRGVVILRPRYELRRYERLVEGDVPMGRRRLLSDFHGMEARTGRVTALHVFEPGAAHSRCDVEVIDANTLWDTWEGAHVFQWRREGTGRHPVPLKQRLIWDKGNGKAE